MVAKIGSRFNQEHIRYTVQKRRGEGSERMGVTARIGVAIGETCGWERIYQVSKS